MKIINADDLIAWIKSTSWATSKIKSIICYIETMPAVDAVETELLDDGTLKVWVEDYTAEQE